MSEVTERPIKLRAKHGIQVEGSQVWLTGFERDDRGRLTARLAVSSPAPIAFLKPAGEDVDDREGDK